MAKKGWVGNPNEISARLKKGWVGNANDVCCKIRKGWIGDANNKAQLIFANGIEPLYYRGIGLGTYVHEYVNGGSSRVGNYSISGEVTHAWSEYGNYMIRSLNAVNDSSGGYFSVDKLVWDNDGTTINAKIKREKSVSVFYKEMATHAGISNSEFSSFVIMSNSSALHRSLHVLEEIDKIVCCLPVVKLDSDGAYTDDSRNGIWLVTYKLKESFEAGIPVFHSAIKITDNYWYSDLSVGDNGTVLVWTKEYANYKSFIAVYNPKTDAWSVVNANISSSTQITKCGTYVFDTSNKKGYYINNGTCTAFSITTAVLWRGRYIPNKNLLYLGGYAYSVANGVTVTKLGGITSSGASITDVLGNGLCLIHRRKLQMLSLNASGVPTAITAKSSESSISGSIDHYRESVFFDVEGLSN